MYQYNLGQFFEVICQKYSDKTAIIFKNSQISFQELNTLANQIANFLLHKGIKKKQVIAIQNSKTPFGFASMIACLKLGVIYTNFDYTNPIERIKKIFHTAQPSLVLADKKNFQIDSLCQEIDIQYIVIDENSGIYNESKILDKTVIDSISGSNPAYIMFTSGSTGIPKGVLIAQHSIINFIHWGKQTYQLSENDIMSNVNPIYFDNSVFDFYCSLFNGITMIAIDKDTIEQPKVMLEMLTQNNCTFWFSVPSMLIYLTNLKLLSKNVLNKVRIFSFGGEAYPKPLLKKLYTLYKEQAQFYNVYGPTEGTCICSAYLIPENEFEKEGLAPLGYIAKNFDYLILDENGKESSFGELYLIGTQLALGYYNDQERTNKSFIQNPMLSYPELMYKTGDLVEIKNNLLYFRGRVDNQIKHMGYRIELEEIENALIKIQGVKQCAVIHTYSKNNFSKIRAFIAVDDSNKQDEDYYYKELKNFLPDYMLPHSFEILNELPKNPNGKVDRVLLSEGNNNAV